jgi:hypothetical protein
MTLTISHGAFVGMCSEFNAWRCAVAKAAGYPTTVELFNGRMYEYELPAFDWDSISEDNIAGAWATPPANPLLVLFVHGDAEGSIEPADALRLADALAKLVIPRKWRTVTEKFIRACRLAGSRNEPMKFERDRAAMMQRLIENILREKFAAMANGRQVTRLVGHRATFH